MTERVDIEFSNLTYQAGRKRIIKGISGTFKGGQLTAIMGPSGAGKSSLMNILVGYVTSGVSGEIRTNGEARRLPIFNKLSSYIMQEDLLQPYLTVRESMNAAAYLKLGSHLTLEQKRNAVEEILETLGLTKCADNFTEHLSGGQRKRVSVALELVNNPPVVFLDEPTTGLDVVAINQTVELLRLLSRQGRTVICTMHQPSSSLFLNLDHVYMLAEGRCIYQGAPSQLVSFMASLHLHCPETYNPADFVFEVLQTETINRMSDEIQNGRLVKTSQELQHIDLLRREDLMLPSLMKNLCFPVSSWMQIRLLFSRMMLQKKRHKAGIWLQIIHHLFSGFLIGTVFQKVGNDASRPFDNFKFVLCVSVFFMYTHCMLPTLSYPMDVKMMKREYFNRWYSLKAYYVAKTFSTIPLNLILCFVFTVIVYLSSDQPMELKRFAWFISNCALITLTAEGLGILIGFTFKCTNGSVVGPSTMAPILMLAMHGMGYGEQISSLMYAFMRFSFLRFSLVSMITALYLDEREMPCQDTGNTADPYCFYRDTRLLVRDLGMSGEQTSHQLYGIFFYLILFRLAAFFALRYRVTTEFSNTLLIYINKILKKK